MLKSSIAVLKKIPNTRRRERKDAEGKGRSWGTECGGAEGQSQGVRDGQGQEQEWKTSCRLPGWSCCIRGKCSLGTSVPLFL